MTLQDALRHFKTRSQIARVLGIERQAITRWKDGIPVRRQFELEILSKGKLKRAKS
jgi:transcriptional repressor of cell division inhibition gene dicB